MMDRLLLCLLLLLVPIGEGLRSRCRSIASRLHAISPTSLTSSAAEPVRPVALQSIAPLATIGNVDLFIQDTQRGACLVATSYDKDCPSGYETLWREVKDVRYRLAIHLLREWRKGPASPFFPYIVNLPAAATEANDQNAIKPIHWAKAELAHFPYVNLAVDVIKQQKNWLTLYDLLLTHPDFRQSPDRPQLLLEQFLWAMEIVSSRAFQGNSNLDIQAIDPRLPVLTGALGVILALVMYLTHLATDGIVAGLLLGSACLPIVTQWPIMFRGASCALLPAIDCVNHRSTSPSSEVEIVEHEKVFRLISKRSIPRLTEVTISYGQRSNDYLLQFFGFVEEDNAWDCYVVLGISKKIEACLLQKKSLFDEVHGSLLEEEMSYEELKRRIQATDKLLLSTPSATNPTTSSDDQLKPLLSHLETIFSSLPNDIKGQCPSNERGGRYLLPIIRDVICWERDAFLLGIERYRERYLIDADSEKSQWILSFFQQKLKVLDAVQALIDSEEAEEE